MSYDGNDFGVIGVKFFRNGKVASEWVKCYIMEKNIMNRIEEHSRHSSQQVYIVFDIIRKIGWSLRQI